MTVDDVLAALELPTEARVGKRVPKKSLAAQAARTTADRRAIDGGLAELLWVAALKPHNTGASASPDPQRPYVEIAVLSARIREERAASVLARLLHRAVPHPVLLVAEHVNALTVSVAHKRASDADASARVVDEVWATMLGRDGARDTALLAALALSRQRTTNLLTLYQGYLDAIVAHRAAEITGAFTLPAAGGAGTDRSVSLIEHERLTREIAARRARARTATQMADRIALSDEIKRLEARLRTLYTAL